MVRRKLPVATEYQECRTYWDWIQHQPKIRDYAFKLVNEGKRSPVTGKLLKLIGFRPGLPDYVILKRNAVYASLWLEVKRTQRSRTSEAQHAIVALLRSQGHYAALAYGADMAIDLTIRYFNDDLALR
jgi:hypothetical protein